MSETLSVSAPLWRWSQDGSPAGGWFFITIDGEDGDAIRAHSAMRRMELGKARGFGSVRVEVCIGGSHWATSVFPSKSHDGYLLPVKAAVRKAEGLAEGDTIAAQVTLA